MVAMINPISIIICEKNSVVPRFLYIVQIGFINVLIAILRSSKGGNRETIVYRWRYKS